MPRKTHWTINQARSHQSWHFRLHLMLKLCNNWQYFVTVLTYLWCKNHRSHSQKTFSRSFSMSSNERETLGTTFCGGGFEGFVFKITWGQTHWKVTDLTVSFVDPWQTAYVLNNDILIRVTIYTSKRELRMP